MAEKNQEEKNLNWMCYKSVKKFSDQSLHIFNKAPFYIYSFKKCIKSNSTDSIRV